MASEVAPQPRYLASLHEDIDPSYSDSHRGAPKRRLGAVLIICLNAILFIGHLLIAGNTDRLFPAETIPPQIYHNARLLYFDITVGALTALWAGRWYFAAALTSIRISALVLLLVIALRTIFQVGMVEEESSFSSFASDVLLYALLPAVITLRYRCLHPAESKREIKGVLNSARQFSLMAFIVVIAQVGVTLIVTHTQAGLAIPEAVPSRDFILALLQGELVPYANQGRAEYGLPPVGGAEVLIQLTHRLSSLVAVAAIALLFIFARKERARFEVFYGYTRWLCCSALLAIPLGLAVVNSLLDSVWDCLYSICIMAMLCFSVMTVLTSNRPSATDQ